MPQRISASASPVTPRPMRRLAIASWRCGSQRVVGDVDDVVEEAHGELHALLEPGEIEAGASA